MKRGSNSKQHRHYKLWMLHVFIELLRKSISERSAGLCKEGFDEYNQILQQTAEFEKVYRKISDEKTLLEREKESTVLNYTDIISSIEKELITEVTKDPKERRDMGKIDHLALQWRTKQGEFEKSITPIQKNLSEKESEYNLVSEKLKKLEARSSKVSDFSSTNGGLHFIIQKYLGISNTHPFLHAVFNVLNPSYAQVRIIDENRQPMLLINLLKLFPDWDIRRLIYLCILSKMLSEDDFEQPEAKRNYEIGYAEELLHTVLCGKEIWVDLPLPDRNYKYADPLLSECADKLNVWLSKPMRFENLVSDPVFIIYSEWYSDRIKSIPRKQQKVAAYKGGWAPLSQIYEFIIFAEKELKNQRYLSSV